jgi:amino acid transporter
MSGLGGVIITLTGLSPSIGVFVTAPVIIQQSGTFVIAACLLAVLLGGIVSGVYAELGSAFPHAGGDYVLIGNTLGPTARFASLAVSLVAIPVVLALSALGVADFLKVVVPAVEPVPCAVVCVMLTTAMAALSLRLNAWITGMFLSVEIMALIATGALGFLHPHNDLIQAVIHPVMASPRGVLQSTPLLAMALAGSAAIYTLYGFGAAVSLGEEVVGARTKLVWIIYGALLLGGATIIPPLAGVVVGAPDLVELSASPTPLQDFIVAVGGQTIASLISVGVAIAIFNAMIAMALIGGRILYAAARENAWHGRLNGALSTVHHTYGSPWVATLTIGAAGLVLCLVPLPVLVMIAGSGATFLYGLLAVGLIAGRRNGVTSGSQSIMPWHPMGPILIILVALGLLAVALTDEAAGRPGVMVTLGVLVVGALYYRLVVRHSSAWAHSEPDEEEVRIVAE